MDQSKVSAITSWPKPTKVKKLQQSQCRQSRNTRGSHRLSINFHKLTSGFTQAFKRRAPFVSHEVSIQCDIPRLSSSYCLDVYMYDHCLFCCLLWVSVCVLVSVSSICFLLLTLFCLPSGLRFGLLILTKIWEWILTLLTRTSHYSDLRRLSTSFRLSTILCNESSGKGFCSRDQGLQIYH